MARSPLDFNKPDGTTLKPYRKGDRWIVVCPNGEQISDASREASWETWRRVRKMNGESF